MTMDIEIYRELTTDQENEIANTIFNQLISDINLDIEQANSKFNFFQTNVSVTEQSSFSEAISDLSTKIANKVSSSFNTKVQGQQTLTNIFSNSKITCLPDGSQTFESEQKIDLRMIVEDTVKSADVTKLMNDTANEIINSNTVEKTQDNTGLSIGIIIMLVIMGCVLIGLVVLFVLWKVRKTATDATGLTSSSSSSNA